MCTTVTEEMLTKESCTNHEYFEKRKSYNTYVSRVLAQQRRYVESHSRMSNKKNPAARYITYIVRYVTCRNLNNFATGFVSAVTTDRQFTYNVTMRRVRATTVVVKKQSVLNSLSVFADLGIQHAMCMRHIVICGLSSSSICFHVTS
jgi:hypothetical protein